MVFFFRLFLWNPRFVWVSFIFILLIISFISFPFCLYPLTWRCCPSENGTEVFFIAEKKFWTFGRLLGVKIKKRNWQMARLKEEKKLICRLVRWIFHCLSFEERNIVVYVCVASHVQIRSQCHFSCTSLLLTQYLHFLQLFKYLFSYLYIQTWTKTVIKNENQFWWKKVKINPQIIKSYSICVLQISFFQFIFLFSVFLEL